MANKTTRLHHASKALLSAASVLVLGSACAVELIDSIIAERGVTECTTGSDEHGTTDSSTSTDETSLPDSTIGAGTSSSSSSENSTSMTATTEVDESTGPTAAVCGDGVVEGDETCDDGNQTPNDGCQECAKDSIVFVTSELYQGFSLEGLYGADQRCRSLADKADLARHLTFKAWLSSSKESANARLIHSKGRYVLVNGLVVAQNWSGLTSGILINPIMVDEISQSRDDAVWTGTLSSGEAALDDEFCEDWDDDSGLLKFAGIGFSSSIDATWSFFEPAPCDSQLRLYCIEQ
jgi:cysteine-rich repeat protein